MDCTELQWRKQCMGLSYRRSCEAMQIILQFFLYDAGLMRHLRDGALPTDTNSNLVMDLSTLCNKNPFCL